MDLILFILSAAFTGLTRGVGVLPDSLIGAVGGNVTFTTTLSPQDGPYTAIWQLNETLIINTNNNNGPTSEYVGRINVSSSTASLELRGLTVNDRGEYSVTTVSQTGSVGNGQTTLKVFVPVFNVSLTANNTDLIEFNSSVSLSCSVSSGSSLSFLWLNGSSDVTDSDRVQITNADGGSTLTIVNVTRYDQRPFRCRAFNPVSSVTSEPANFTISYGPENVSLTVSPSQEFHGQGSDVTLSCSADSRPSAQFYWFLNGSQLSAPDTGPELRLMNIQMNQSGSYSCQAFNPKTLRYETSQATTVSVLERISNPSIKPSTNLPIETNSFNLTCDATGSVFTRKWLKDGKDLNQADNMMLSNNSRVLSFQPLRKTDSGQYSCEVNNSFSAEEAKYNMVVNYGPDNVRINGLNEINVGQTLTLTCSAESQPAATFTWKLNGFEIQSETSPIFNKQKVQLSDNGTYTCEAMNSVTGRRGSAVHQLSVTVGPDPPKSGLPAGAIAGIVIACFVICGLAAGGGYYICRQRKGPKASSNRSTNTRTGGGAQDNAGFSENGEVNYADVSFFQNKAGGRVQLGSQNDTSDYAQVRVNNNHPSSSTPPTYDVHMQRQNRATPQPAANGAQIYAQVRK